MYDSSLPVNLTCVSQLTQLGIQSAFWRYYGLGQVPVDVDLEWHQLTALQSVTILGWAKWQLNVLQLCRLPQLWHFGFTRCRLCDRYTRELMAELEETFACWCPHVEVVIDVSGASLL